MKAQKDSINNTLISMIDKYKNIMYAIMKALHSIAIEFIKDMALKIIIILVKIISWKL